MTLDPKVIRERLQEARICLLLSRSLCRRDPVLVLDEALESGVDMIQIREPGAGDRELLEWVHDVRERAGRYQVPVLVNNRVDIALLAGAEGVHVGQDDLPARAVRELAGTNLLVGLSTHDLFQVTESGAEPVDYIGVGPVFATGTKELEGQGPELLAEVLCHATVPAFAIGGLHPGNIDEAVAAGARRVAVSSCVCAAEHPGDVVQALVEALPVT